MITTSLNSAAEQEQQQPQKGEKSEGIVRAFLRNRKSKFLTCRICLEQDHRLQMISPCECKGTSEFVHKSCLSKWRSIDGASRFRCEVCHSHYKFCRSWVKAGTIFDLFHSLKHFILGLIRFGCWFALLAYGYLILSITQWAISWLGLYPRVPRVEAHGFQWPMEPKFIISWFENVSVGPAVLLISTCVSLKKNRRGFQSFFKWISVWAILYYLSFLSLYLSIISDLLYIGLSIYGIFRTIRHSFSTAHVIAPTVAVVLVDLHRLQN